MSSLIIAPTRSRRIFGSILLKLSIGQEAKREKEVEREDLFNEKSRSASFSLLASW
jgi:hypothetical protein